MRRSHILEDSFRVIMASKLKVECLRNKLWITLEDEVGLDYGGVSREWFYAVIFQELFINDVTQVGEGG